MSVLAVHAPAHDAVRYTVRIAADADEVAAAQRLRHRVFAGELGARLRSPATQLDVDPFDEHCDHLVVVDESTGAVVGTYRMLPPGRAPRRYSEGEFDLSALAPIQGDLVEAGRSCVDAAHRDGAVINLMWAGIARYLHLTGHRWLAGCASVGLGDGGATAAGVWDLATRRHLSPPGYRVLPHRPWTPVERPAAASLGSSGAVSTGRLPVPPLLKGYLRLGAWICGAPAYDPDFACADFFVLLSLDRIDPRYLRRFLGERP